MQSIHEIKQELQTLTAKELTELCLRLAKFKKENKEMLAYLLFDAHNAEAYSEQIKENMRETFKDVNTVNLYLAKKTLRKILRQANRYIKYTSSKQTEADVLMHFCFLFKNSGIAIHKNKAITNMYLQQIKKIRTALSTLHEDIQYDLLKQVNQLETDV